MRRFTGALCSTVLACVSSSPPPGPSPLPEAWRPADALRERVPRSGSRPIVLDDADGLSPDEAAILAIDQNPRLRAVRAQRGLGQAELIGAGILPNPRLEGSLDFPAFSSDEAKVLGYGAGLSWNVTPLLSRGARVSAAEENLASVDLEVAWQEWQVAQAARLHAVRTIYIERRARLGRELEETWRQRLDGLRQARAASAVTELEVSSGERSFAEARVSRLDLDQRAVSERSELDRALGIDGTQDVVLDASFTLTSTAPRREDLLAEIPRHRLDLIALQHAFRSHDSALRAEVIAQFPPVEIGFHVSRGVDRVGSAGVTLSFDIPFFDRNQRNVARASAERTQVEAEYDARLIEARADVIRTIKEQAIVREQLAATREASEAAGRLAEQARAAAVSGALSPLLASDILERSYGSRLRVLEIEQTLAELEIALALVSGTDAP